MSLSPLSPWTSPLSPRREARQDGIAYAPFFHCSACSEEKRVRLCVLCAFAREQPRPLRLCERTGPPPLLVEREDAFPIVLHADDKPKTRNPNSESRNKSEIPGQIRSPNIEIRSKHEIRKQQSSKRSGQTNPKFITFRIFLLFLIRICFEFRISSFGFAARSAIRICFAFRLSSFGFPKLVIRICFGFRASDFGLSSIRVVVEHQHREPRAIARLRVFEHLLIAGRVAEGGDQPAPEVLRTPPFSDP